MRIYFKGKCLHRNTEILKISERLHIRVGKESSRLLFTKTKANFETITSALVAANEAEETGD